MQEYLFEGEADCFGAVAVDSIVQDAREVRQEAGEGDSANVALLAEGFEPLVHGSVLLGHALLPEVEALGAGVEQFLLRLPQLHYAK